MQPTEGEDLSKWMRWLMTSHVRRYHRDYGTSGHVWQGRFKSFIVEDDDHLLTAIRYVEGNPVQAQTVRSAIDWPWSSHLASLGSVSERSEVTAPCSETFDGVGQTPEVPVPEQTALVDRGLITLPDDWTSYVDTPLTGKQMNSLKRSLQRQVPFGS